MKRLFAYFLCVFLYFRSESEKSSLRIEARLLLLEASHGAGAQVCNRNRRKLGSGVS